MTEIQTGEFAGNKEIKGVEIPSTVKIIDAEAFSLCTNLKKVVLPEGLLTMGENAFYGCKSLEHIIIPGSLKEIPKGAFLNCTNLKQLEIQNGTEIIGEEAFNNTALENIILPASIKKIKTGAFLTNTVRKITIGSNVSVGNNSFFYNFAQDYKEQDKDAGIYVIVPTANKNGAVIAQIKEKEVWLNWIPEKNLISYHNIEGTKNGKEGKLTEAISEFSEFSTALQLLPSIADSSEEQIEQRLTILKNRVITYNNSAWGTEYAQEALDDYSEIISLSKDILKNGMYLYQMALINYRLQQFDESCVLLNRAIELKTENTEKYQEALKKVLGEIHEKK